MTSYNYDIFSPDLFLKDVVDFCDDMMKFYLFYFDFLSLLNCGSAVKFILKPLDRPLSLKSS